MHPPLSFVRSWARRPEAPSEAAVFFALALVVSLPVAPFVLSLSMWFLVFTAFWSALRDSGQAQKNQSGILLLTGRVLAFSFRRLFTQPAYAAMLLLLLAPALSGLWSDDGWYWLARVRVRLPFLVLPWVFANLPALSTRQLNLVLYGLVIWMTALCLGVGANYFLHYAEILDAMREGRPIPVPRNHIRFSLLVGTAVLAGGWLWQQRWVWRFAWERSALGAAVVFLFVFVHVLSVRSGLAALYTALLISLVCWVWRSRKWSVALAALILLFLAPWLAIQTMPSLKQKLAYTVYDWQQYRENTGATYSDAERWVSLKTGWQIWQEHPWLGVGAGDLQVETKAAIARNFPGYTDTPKLPHNQFLYILAGTGLFGLALSLLGWLVPVFAGPQRSDALVLAFQGMAWTSFLVEYTLETAIGLGWFLFFTLWFLKRARDGRNATQG